MRWKVEPAVIGGRAEVPGDKSIAHRALMVGALAQGTSRIDHVPSGEDVTATIACLRELGVGIDMAAGAAVVAGQGALEAPCHDLYARNSGTTMRLLSGVLAGQPFRSRLTGDASLSRRPMARIIEPLTRMGAEITARDNAAPLEIRGGTLRGITYSLPIPSAQVKSSILLAGLFAAGETTVRETARTRDHTERMFLASGIDLERRNGTVVVRGGQRPRPLRLTVPGDISSAAFLFAAALLTGGEVSVQGLGVNPTRTPFLDVLARMGATVELEGQREELGEPVATVRVSGAARRAVTLDGQDVPALLDELPLVALLGTAAQGDTVVRGAAELRVKESDRIRTVVDALRALGASVDELPDGFAVHGPTPLRGAIASSQGDHRIAMMLAVAGCGSHGTMVIRDADAAAVSFPEFADVLRSLGGQIDAEA